MNSDRMLDCIGLFCPMPIARTKQELDKMNPGQVLEIMADDPGFEKDLPAWCRMTGEILIGMEKENGLFKGYVKKK